MDDSTWTIVTAVCTIVLALAALVSVWLLHNQIRQEAQLSRRALGLEAMWRLDEEWDSANMRKVRANAARALLTKKPSVDINLVLNFFESIARFVKTGIVDDESAWHAYYYNFSNYWSASRIYIDEVREEDPTMWEDLDDYLMPQLIKIEARRRNRSPVPPTETETTELLNDEKDLT